MGGNKEARPQDALDHTIEKAMNPARGIALGMIFQLNGLVFKVTYINPSKRRFSAELLRQQGGKG